MPISFTCDQCGRSLNVRDDLAGADIYCPDCRAILTVPGAEAEDSMLPWEEQGRPTPESAEPMASPAGNFDDRGMPVPTATPGAYEPPAEVAPTARRPGTIDETKPRPLLILAGLGLLGAAGAALVAMVITGKVRAGLVKVMVFFGVFGFATLLRGLGNRQQD